MREQILAALSQYGSPVLFGVVTVAAAGVPLPVTLLLIVTGSLASQGFIGLGWAIAVASAGAVLGDQAGYAIGRWGGQVLVGRFGKALGGPSRLAAAEERARRWGGPGIFFSRWLVGALGPAVNLVSGAARYPWPRFFVWDVLGEAFGSALYVLLGATFSDRVQELDALLGDLTWALVALAAALYLGWRLAAHWRE